MSIQECAVMALQCQDACNLSGVAKSFARVTTELWVAANAAHEGTAWVNQHPISKLFVAKLADLAGLGLSDRSFDSYEDAYQDCKALAEKDVL